MQTSFFPNRLFLIALVGIAQILPAEDLDVRVPDGTDIAILIDFDGIRRSGADLGTIASDAIDDSVRGVPALSGPVGSRAIGLLPQARNKDINERTDASWPRVGSGIWSGWRHSDIKDIAMPFVFGVFPDISGAMED